MALRSLFKLQGAAFAGNYTFSRCFHLQKKVLKRQVLVCVCSHVNNYCTHVTQTPDSPREIEVRFENGLPSLLVPLPSRREVCQFTLRPISNTLGDLTSYLQAEDHGIDRVVAFSSEGNRIAQSTPIDILLQNDFELVINDVSHSVKQHESVVGLSEHSTDLSHVKILVSQLYSQMNIEQHQMDREKELLTQLEELRMEIQPLEKYHHELSLKAVNRTRHLSWLGLGLMSFQFGILARLTWWEYSWDIMEPVTYFVTYGTSMAMFAYYVLTRQEYNFTEVRDREYLLSLHKYGKKTGFNIEDYNKLRNAISQCETDLRRLRDPLQLHLPIQTLEPKKHEQELP